MRKRNQKRGFTLVEMAVVLVIIGLIIGAVIKGQELIENARINSVINQVNGIRSAVISFQDKYNALPGDISNVTTRIPGCAACVNGNGTGAIDALNGNINVASGAEGTAAWQHLAYANMITGVTPGVAGNAYGVAYPGARTGGGFVIVNTAVGTPALQGHWLRLQNTAGNAAANAAAGQAALTPGQAAVIDRRMDDGNALTGTVRANGAGVGCADGAGVYAEAVSTRNCNMFFQM